ncbi:MAG: hypothetical protein ACKO0W_10195 [Planctomycetota bacterium]
MKVFQRILAKFIAIAIGGDAVAAFHSSPPGALTRVGEALATTVETTQEGSNSGRDDVMTAQLCRLLASPVAAEPRVTALLVGDKLSEAAAREVGVALLSTCFHDRYGALLESLSPAECARIALALRAPLEFDAWIEDPSSRKSVEAVSAAVVAAERDFANALSAVAGEERQRARDRLDIDRIMRMVPRSGAWRPPASFLAERRLVNYDDRSALLEGAGARWAALLDRVATAGAYSRPRSLDEIDSPSVRVGRRCEELLAGWRRETAEDARVWLGSGLREREAANPALRVRMCRRALRLLASLHDAAVGSEYSIEADRWLLFCVERELGDIGGFAGLRVQIARARLLRGAAPDAAADAEVASIEASLAPAIAEFARLWDPASHEQDEHAARTGQFTSNRRLLHRLEARIESASARLR